VFGLRRSSRAVNGDVPVVAADLTDAASLRCLPSGITRIAYLPSPDARTESAYRTVFIIGLRNLLDAVDTAQLQRIVFVSSSAVYGDLGGGCANENTPPRPLGFNGAMLLEAERWLAAQKLPATVLRLAGLYGPTRTRLYQRLVAGKVRVPRSRRFWANRIHVDDAAAAIVHLLFLAQPEPLYLGVDDTPLPLDVLYDYLAGLLNAPLPADGPPPDRIGNKRLSNVRLRQSGFVLQWPDARAGYARLLQQEC
jgi:nucleoside-diphosphate-sugar epimerase